MTATRGSPLSREYLHENLKMHRIPDPIQSRGAFLVAQGTIHMTLFTQPLRWIKEMKRFPKVLRAFCAVYFSICSTTYGDSQVAIPSAVDQYNAELQKVVSSKVSQSLEPIFLLGMTAASELLNPSSDKKGAALGTVLESLNPSRFDQVSKKMEGFVLNKGTVFPSASSDPRFWSDLARSKGTKTDFEFFRIYNPAGVQSEYFSLETDESGCVNFGNKKLTAAYVRWSDWVARYPNAYAEIASEQLQQVATDLDSTCPCGDKPSVITELEYFLSTVPASQRTVHVREHLANIKADKPDTLHRRPTPMKYNCFSS